MVNFARLVTCLFQRRNKLGTRAEDGNLLSIDGMQQELNGFLESENGGELVIGANGQLRLEQ